MMISAAVLASLALISPPAGVPKASDWITTGPDCLLYAGGDITGDGFADLLTINGGRDLCVAASVHGWKASGWVGIANDLNPAAIGLAVAEVESTWPGLEAVVVEKDRAWVLGGYKDGKLSQRKSVGAPDGKQFTSLAPSEEFAVVDTAGDWWQLKDGVWKVIPAEARKERTGKIAVDGPPYDAGATEILHFTSGFLPEGGKLEWGVFKTSLPHEHHVIRVAVAKSPFPNDADADGLTDDEEIAIGTDPYNRDTDGDGLLDGWEVHGLPRGVDLGPLTKLYRKDCPENERDLQLNPLRKDAICSVSYFEGVKPDQFRAEMTKVNAVYNKLNVKNPDGTTGVWVHFIELPGFVPKADQSMPWWDVGNKYFPPKWHGMVHWMQITPWGGGQSSENGDMGGAGNGWQVFSHEFGHQLSLSHSGDSEPAWCPLYPSMMSYAFSYSFDGDGNKVHFSNGEFRETVLDEHKLVEKLPYPYEKVKYLANHPFRFTLKDNGDGTTLIDWNHDGVFSDPSTTVEADINYGGSTHCGERKTHELVGSAPALAYIGGTCVLATLTQNQAATTVKTYLGGEKWSEPHAIANSSSRFDPVLVGGPEEGLVFLRKFQEWMVAKVKLGAKAEDAPTLEAPAVLGGLPLADLGAVRVGQRVLLVTRHDSNALEYRWLSVGEKMTLSEPKAMKATSMVAPGMVINPADQTILMVGSAKGEKTGPFCMQLTTLTVKGGEIEESEPAWTHDGHANHCTTRPVPVFHVAGKDAAPQLVIFHTGWSDGNGTWTAWRTMQVGNKALDGGWLTSQLYDEWTRSRVGVGFADGPQGAIYAFRWDPGDHRDWKINTLLVAHNGYGIDDKPMRDFDDASKIGLWGIRHSILTMPGE